MRRIQILILSLLSLCVACSGPTRLELQRAVAIQSQIDAIEALHRQLKFPKHFEKEPLQKHGDEFSVMQTLPFFPHLRMEEGYVLDYVYEFRGIGGEPMVYARKADASSFKDLESYLASIREPAHLNEVDKVWREYTEANDKASGDTDASIAAFEKLQVRLAEIPDHDVTHWYLRHIATDGSDDGFLELAALRLICDQFYLFWHAIYKENTVVLTKEKAVEVMSALGDSKAPQFPNKKKPPKLTATLLCPKIERTTSAVTVSFHVFSRWGGLSRRTFQFSLLFPHRLTESKSEVIVPYDCGIVF